MYSHRLRSYDYSPPGGYCFEENGPPYKKFPCLPTAESQAQAVLDFRIGNSLPRATIQQALRDVDYYQCLRLGFNPKWCVPADVANVLPLNSTSPIIAPCKGCGVILQQ